MLQSSHDSLLHRANESLEDLRMSFEDKQRQQPSGRRSQAASAAPPQPSSRHQASASAEELRSSGGRGAAWSEGQFHNDLSYRAAAGKLAELVSSRDSAGHGRERPPLARGVQFTPPLTSQYLASDDKRASWQNMPVQATKAELVELLENQTAFIRALEIQTQFTDADRVRKSQSAGNLRPAGSLQDITRASVDQFRDELQRVSAMHQTRNDRLETELKQYKADLAQRDEELDQLKADLRRLMSDNADLASGGLSALPVVLDRSGLPVGSSGGQVSLIETLRRERDNLVESVTTLKQKLEESRQREQELYDQLTASIETVEQAKLEESNALLGQRQLSDELSGLRGRLDDLLAAQSRRLDEARAAVREQADGETAGLRRRLQDAEDELATAGARLERLDGERRSLGQQLEEARSQLRLHETELTRGRDELASAATRASLHRDQAVSELGRVRQQLEQERVDRTAERDRLQSQLSEARTRLAGAEQGAQQGGEERLRLTNRVQALMRDLQLARSGAESASRAARQAADAQASRASQREAELLGQLGAQEARHEAAAGELQRLLDQHAGLADRLRRELRRSAEQLAGLQAAAYQETSELAAERDQATERLQRCQARLRDVEKQLGGHTKAEAELRDRVRALAGQQQEQSRNSLQLLAGHSALQRERDQLAKEAEFLRHQLQAGPGGNAGLTATVSG